MMYDIKTVPLSVEPPQNCIPVKLSDSSMGIEIFKYSQVATLSPVQMAPVTNSSVLLWVILFGSFNTMGIA